jgi:hypothetical protein
MIRLVIRNLVSALHASPRRAGRRAGHTVGLAALETAVIAVPRGAGDIVTRKIAHFQGCGLALIDLWSGP